jgi:hypothetical protein
MTTTTARLTLDRAEAGKAPTLADLDVIPAFQWRIYHEELARLCPSRLEPEQTRQRNALRIEILPDGHRCSRRSPDGRGLAWLLSGGSVTSYGRCEVSACPRAKERRDG